MLARLCQQCVEEVEIKLSFCGFDLLPGNRYLQCIGMHLFDGRPYLGQHRGIVAGIICLRAKHQKRCAIDEQCKAAITLDEFG